MGYNRATIDCMKKTKRILFVTLCMSALFQSCNNNGNYGGSSGFVCQGTIRFANNSSNPYTVSVSGQGSFVMPGRS